MNEIIVDKDDAIFWIKQLRSGKFNQAQGHLQTTRGYCCIGVALKTLCNKHNHIYPTSLDGYICGGLPELAVLPPRLHWLAYINRLSTILTHSITHLNDQLLFTFPQIANILEAWLIENNLKKANQLIEVYRNEKASL